MPPFLAEVHVEEMDLFRIALFYTMVLAVYHKIFASAYLAMWNQDSDSKGCSFFVLSDAGLISRTAARIKHLNLFRFVVATTLNRRVFYISG